MNGLMRQGRMMRWAPLLLALGALVLYLRTLAPTITWENGAGDSGELAAVAVTLGLAHPTGYPLYILVGHLFTLQNWIEPARALNLLSALAAAGTVGLTALLVQGQGRESDSLEVRVISHTCQAAEALGQRAPAAGRVAGAAYAAISLAFAPVFWTQAVVAETRTLATATMAATLACLLSVHTGRRHPAWAALAFGLSLANHLMSLTLLPSTALLIARSPLLHRWRHAAFTIGGLAVGPVLYLYLPLRAAAHPVLNWGDPHTADRFLWVVSGAQYHHLVGLADPGGIGLALAALPRQIGWPALGLAAVGLGCLRRRIPMAALALLAPILLSIVLTLSYRAEAAPIYILPAVVCLAALAGNGLAAVVGALLARAYRPWPWSGRTRRSALSVAAIAGLAAILLLGLGAQAQQSYGLVARVANPVARDFGTAALVELAPRAVVLVQSDDYTFSLWYARYGLGHRTDVAIVNIDLLQWPWYAQETAESLAFPPAVRAGFIDPGPSGDLSTLRVAMLARAVLPHRPLYVIPLQPSLLSICDQVLRGSLYHCVAPSHVRKPGVGSEA